MIETTRVLLADDHALMREGLKQLFSLVDDIDIVAEAGCGSDVFEVLRRTNIDLILLDMTMPGMSGATLIQHIASQDCCPRILVLSMHEEPQIARRALEAGASGYITKDSNPHSLISAVRKVAMGGRFIDHKLAEQVLFERSSRKTLLHEKLTVREFEIFQQLVRGRCVNEIAGDLSISNKTVSTHKARLMHKMKCEHSTHLIRYALTHGLLE